MGLYIHPSILDSMLQSAVVLMSNQNDVSDLLPRSINWLVVHRQVEDVMLIHTKLKQAGRKETIYDVTLTNTHGIVIAELEGLVIRSITEGRVGLDDMYNCDWKEVSQVPSVYSVDASEGQDIVFITDRVPKVEIPEWMKKATEAARNGEKAEEAMTGEDKNEEAVKDEEKAEEEMQENEKDANTEKALALMPKANKEIVCQYSLSDQNYDHLPDSVEEALKQQDVSAIALMCLTPFDDSDDSETLQEKISNVCFLIRSVMMRAADLGHVAPLYVCTSKAWPSPEHKTSSHTVNPLMTAIWGMTRCALREQLYPNLITVEVQVPEGQLSVDFLQRALAVVGREKALQDYPELLVTGSAVYVNQMVQVGMLFLLFCFLLLLLLSQLSPPPSLRRCCSELSVSISDFAPVCLKVRPCLSACVCLFISLSVSLSLYSFFLSSHPFSFLSFFLTFFLPPPPPPPNPLFFFFLLPFHSSKTLTAVKISVCLFLSFLSHMSP